MFPWKRKAEQPSAAGDDLPGFTRAQRARLTRLRAHLRSRAPDLTYGLDARRLEFARWLVKHGRLSEGKDGQKEPSTVPWWKRQPSTSSTPAESARGNR